MLPCSGRNLLCLPSSNKFYDLSPIEIVLTTSCVSTQSCFSLSWFPMLDGELLLNIDLIPLFHFKGFFYFTNIFIYKKMAFIIPLLILQDLPIPVI